MAEEKKGGVSVYISPEIVEVLKQRHKKNYEAGVAAGTGFADDAGAVDRFTCTLLFTCGAWDA